MLIVGEDRTKSQFYNKSFSTYEVWFCNREKNGFNPIVELHLFSEAYLFSKAYYLCLYEETSKTNNFSHVTTYMRK